MEKRKPYSVSVIVVGCILGCAFIALGLGVLIALLSSVIRAGGSKETIAVIVPILFLVVCPIAFGCIPLVMAIKRIRYIRREKRAEKSGAETTAKLLDWKTVSYRDKQNKRYALKLHYMINGEQKTFTTDYLFDINEFRYLQSRRAIQVKVYGNFVTVTEPFPDDIYTIHPRFGIETAFFEQGRVQTTLRVFRICFAVALTLLLAAIVCTVVLHNGKYLIVAAILFVAVSTLFAIILAVFFFRWTKRKR